MTLSGESNAARLGSCSICEGAHTIGSGRPNGVDCSCGRHFHFGDDLWVRTDKCIVCPSCERALSPLDFDQDGRERSRVTLPNESDAGVRFYSDATARKAYRLLHHHATNGYERGDCHCEACGVIVEDLAEWFGFTPEKDSDTRGIYDPAALVRTAARERGWQ